jgi:ATP-dependent DNA ligase
MLELEAGSRPPMLHPNNTKPAPKYVKRSQERHDSGFVPKLARPAISRRAGQASGPGPIGSSQPTKGRGHTVRDSTLAAAVPIKSARCRCVSVPAPGLGIIEPCLPSPAKAPPSGPGWIHEIKHDGFRILARRDSAGVRLITRAGNDFSSRFPFIAMAVGKLPVQVEQTVCVEAGTHD